MRKVTGKRVIAYVLDIIIVYFIVSLFAGIEGINTTQKKYDETYQQYLEVYENFTESINKDTESLKDIEVQLTDISYQLSKYGGTITLINIVCSILYFVVFAYYNKGQTIGMKLLKIKVVSADNKVPSFVQIMSRSLIIYSIITGTISFMLLQLASQTTYLKYGTSIQAIDIAVVAISLVLMMFRQDGKGLHDLFSNTLVVSTYLPNEISEANYVEKEVKTEEKVEEPKQIKSTTTKKKTKTTKKVK